MPDNVTYRRFQTLGMLYSAMWGYLDHYIGNSAEDEIVEFHKTKSLDAVQSIFKSISIDLESDPTLMAMLEQDSQQFAKLALKVSKHSRTELQHSRGLGATRQFATYLMAQSQRYGEAARTIVAKGE